MIEKSDFCGDWPYMVRCPVCKYDYTHHGSVAVYDRDREDAPTKIAWIGPETPPDKNPSGRRDAVGIAFKGECGHIWWMNIVQHKGQTFIEFDIEKASLKKPR